VTTAACESCGAGLALANVFPGGAARCAACGAENRVPAAPHARANASTPYRVAAARLAEPAPLACPLCGGETSASSRECPHCDVLLSRVRCPTCFALQSIGARACAHCGHELELEPLLDPSGAPCPRCSGAVLAAVPGDGGTHECTRCGGLFLGHATLARIVESRREAGPLPTPGGRPFELVRAGARVEREIRYLKCPLCHEAMNRANFGKRSGIVVDVCRRHGTWFDPGELTQAVEWVASGGTPPDVGARPSTPALTPREARARQAEARALVAVMNESFRETRDEARRVALTGSLVDALIHALLGW
jgi:Zn-finger nucleic acid-binding protein